MTSMTMLPKPKFTTTAVISSLRLDESSNGIVMTPEEFDSVEDWDDLFDYELIRGVVIVNPLPLEGEVDPNEQLGHLLRDYNERHPQGRSLDKTLSERYVQLRDGRRNADRVIWAGLGRRPNPKADVPTIVVEFVSRRRRDYHRDFVVKRTEYLALGVKEYWVIDRFRGEMSIFRPYDERKIGRGETYRTDLLPGFVLPLEALLTIADEWRDAD